MTTTIKHVTLKSLGKNKDIDPSKGTVVNPFTQEEYNSLNQTGEWTGGYVEAMGYVEMSIETDAYSSFYCWPDMPISLFIELCKQYLTKDAVFNDICYAFSLTQLVKDYFHRYWYAEGDKTLTSDEFNAIISAIGNLSPTGTSNVTINNKVYQCRQYNLSGNSTYKYIFGSTCFVYYYNNTPVGFKDDYDFNPLSDWTIRGIKGELYTRAMDILGPFYGAQNYHIRYGIYN